MKRLWLFLFLTCTACTQAQRLTSFFDNSSVGFTNTTQVSPQNSPIKTVSMLLPLSGEQSIIGQEMQNAALLAQRENPMSPVRLLFFDTQGTPEGAKEAHQWAEAQNSDLILGPVFASELQSIRQSFLPHTDILSYTSDSTLLDARHASFALLINNQIDTIIHQACLEGKTKIAALGPNNKTGEIVMNSLDDSIQKCPNMQLIHYGFYDEKEENLTPAILKILPPVVDPKKKDLTPEEQQILATPMEERVDFDTLIVFEDGIRLSQVMAILAFYDINPKVLPIYTLANAKLIKDRSLNGVMFADLPPETKIPFTQRYQSVFSKKPNPLALLAYDSVSWVMHNAFDEKLNLSSLQQDSFEGTNGFIRLNPDGTNTRSLQLVRKVGQSTLLLTPPTQLINAWNMVPKTTEESIDLTLKFPESSAESPQVPVQSNDSAEPVANLVH